MQATMVPIYNSESLGIFVRFFPFQDSWGVIVCSYVTFKTGMRAQVTSFVCSSLRL